MYETRNFKYGGQNEERSPGFVFIPKHVDGGCAACNTILEKMQSQGYVGGVGGGNIGANINQNVNTTSTGSGTNFKNDW